jgi:hypothetical protein
VPEAHQPLAAVEHVLDIALGVSARSDIIKHLQHAAGGASMERTRQRADGCAQRRSNVRAGRCDYPRRKGRSVHAVLSRRDPIGVDRLDVLGVGLAAPADQEPLGDPRSFVDLALGHRRFADPARRLRDERQRHHGRTG